MEAPSAIVKVGLITGDMQVLLKVIVKGSHFFSTLIELVGTPLSLVAV